VQYVVRFWVFTVSVLILNFSHSFFRAVAYFSSVHVCSNVCEHFNLTCNSALHSSSGKETLVRGCEFKKCVAQQCYDGASVSYVWQTRWRSAALLGFTMYLCPLPCTQTESCFSRLLHIHHHSWQCDRTMQQEYSETYHQLWINQSINQSNTTISNAP